MTKRAAALAAAAVLAAAGFACSSAESKVVDQYFTALRANDRGTVPYLSTYRQEFELGPQTEKQFRFSVLCPEDGWTEQIPISIMANGRAFETRGVLLKDLDARKEELVVVVSESSGSFRKNVGDPI